MFFKYVDFRIFLISFAIGALYIYMTEIIHTHTCVLLLVYSYRKEITTFFLIPDFINI